MLSRYNGFPYAIVEMHFTKFEYIKLHFITLVDCCKDFAWGLRDLVTRIYVIVIIFESHHIICFSLGKCIWLFGNKKKQVLIFCFGFYN